MQRRRLILIIVTVLLTPLLYGALIFLKQNVVEAYTQVPCTNYPNIELCYRQPINQHAGLGGDEILFYNGAPVVTGYRVVGMNISMHDFGGDWDAHINARLNTGASYSNFTDSCRKSPNDRMCLGRVRCFDVCTGGSNQVHLYMVENWGTNLGVGIDWADIHLTHPSSGIENGVYIQHIDWLLVAHPNNPPTCSINVTGDPPYGFVEHYYDLWDHYNGSVGLKSGDSQGGWNLNYPSSDYDCNNGSTGFIRGGDTVLTSGEIPPYDIPSSAGNKCTVIAKVKDSQGRVGVCTKEITIRASSNPPPPFSCDDVTWKAIQRINFQDVEIPIDENLKNTNFRFDVSYPGIGNPQESLSSTCSGPITADFRFASGLGDPTSPATSCTVTAVFDPVWETDGPFYCGVIIPYTVGPVASNVSIGDACTGEQSLLTFDLTQVGLSPLDTVSINYTQGGNSIVEAFDIVVDQLEPVGNHEISTVQSTQITGQGGDTISAVVDVNTGHTFFSAGGNYNVIVTVTDVQGESANDSDSFTIDNLSSPQAEDISLDPYYIQLSSTVAQNYATYSYVGSAPFNWELTYYNPPISIQSGAVSTGGLNVVDEFEFVDALSRVTGNFANLEISNACGSTSVTSPIRAVGGAGWLQTLGGDVYANQGLDGIDIPATATSIDVPSEVSSVYKINTTNHAYFSSYIFSLLSGNITPQAERISRPSPDWLLDNYSDRNRELYFQSTGYNTWLANTGFKDILTRNNQELTTGLETEVISIIGQDNDVAIEVSDPGTGNSLTTSPGSVCSGTKVIFVPGNLTIQPPFKSNHDSACVFIVGGRVTVGAGPPTGSTPGGVSYDQIDAFVIARSLWDTGSTSNQLYWNGSVLYGDTGTTDRSVTGTSTPSEVVTYNPKYLELLRDLLGTGYDFKVREVNYSGN